MTPELLRVVGRYEILRLLGRGGMASVHLARQPALDREVALKELRSAHVTDAASAQRFLNESRVAGALNHPSIVSMIEYFEHDGVPFIAMEYLERGSLRPLVGQLTLAQVAGVLDSVLAGLAEAAAQGIVHRDLKPENVLVTADGHAKVADFGIAKAIGQVRMTDFRTATGQIVGTPAYMAPEQITGSEITPQADVYATGLLAYELLAGRHPFDGTDAPMALLMRHLNEDPPPLASVRPDLPPGVVAWVHGMLAKEPAMRPAGAAAAWDRLEGVVSDALGPRWRRDAALDGAERRPGRGDRACAAERAVRDLLDRAAAPADADRARPDRTRAVRAGPLPPRARRPGVARSGARGAGAARPSPPPAPPLPPARPGRRAARRGRGDHVLDGARRGAAGGPAAGRAAARRAAPRGGRAGAGGRREAVEGAVVAHPGGRSHRCARSLARGCPRDRGGAQRGAGPRRDHRLGAPPARPRRTRAHHAVGVPRRRPRRAAAAGRGPAARLPRPSVGAARVAAGAHRDRGPASVRDRRRRAPAQGMGRRRAGRRGDLARNGPSCTRGAAASAGLRAGTHRDRARDRDPPTARPRSRPPSRRRRRRPPSTRAPSGARRRFPAAAAPRGSGGSSRGSSPARAASAPGSSCRSRSRRPPCSRRPRPPRPRRPWRCPGSPASARAARPGTCRCSRP